MIGFSGMDLFSWSIVLRVSPLLCLFLLREQDRYTHTCATLRLGRGIPSFFLVSIVLITSERQVV
jgi:hypothetical protein